MSVEEEYRFLLEERARRLEREMASLSGLFAEQVKFVEDPSPRKAAMCSRRAGKTYASGALLLKNAQKYANGASLYLALTRGQAKNIMWPVLRRQIQEMGLQGVDYNEVELVAKLDNGHRIICSGADNPGMLERIRGGAYASAVIDEAASFTDLRLNYLIQDILVPAMADYGGGELAMIGTPNAACAGYFHDVTTGSVPNWTVHKWSILDNGKFPQWVGKQGWRTLAEKYVAKVMVEMSWDLENPTYLREWCGKWVRDQNSLVYFHDESNLYSELPGLEYETVIGVDLGYDDATAFEVIAFSHETNVAYEVDSFEQSGMIPGDIAAVLRDYQERYEPISIVIDTGGLGKAISEEFKRRYQIPVKAAEKTKKNDYITMLNDDLRNGRVKVRSGGDLSQEWDLLQWDGGDKRREHPAYKNHLSDAFLYAWRESLHWTHRPQAVVPSVHDPHRPQWEAAEMERRVEEQWQENQSKEWWMTT